MWNEVAASWHQSILLLSSKHKTKTKGNLWNHRTIDKAKMPGRLHCAVPENIHTSPTEGIGICVSSLIGIFGGLRKNPTVGEVSLVIFWNYTVQTVAL